MALEAVVYPQDTFNYGYKDCYNAAGNWGSYINDFCFQENDDANFLGILENSNYFPASSPSSMIQNNANSSSPETCTEVFNHPFEPPLATTLRRKRRRTKSVKNKEEIENQRMTHIAVERNRRKQMNEYLSVLRSLMPTSYVQRGDQASIIGGAINFVKELEQLLQTMEVQKKSKQQQKQKQTDMVNGNFSSPFSEFFTFPQYSTRGGLPTKEDQNQWGDATGTAAAATAAVADIEVTMVESHANLKILAKKRPRQLLKMVAGLQCLKLSVLHLNVTTADQLVLFSVSVKVEEGCHLHNVDEIAAAVNQMLHTINEEEAAFS